MKFSEGEGGSSKYLFNAGNGVYYMIAARSDQDAEAIYARFDVTGRGLDYLPPVNKLNALPEGWEEAIETVKITNSVGNEVMTEKKSL